MLDTSTVILLGRIRDPESLPEQCVISAITLAELSVGPLATSDPREAAARQEHVQQAEADFEIIPFDAAAARSFAAVASSLRASGRKPRARAYDALIAATAISNGMSLYTANPSDFTAIDGLTVNSISVS